MNNNSARGTAQIGELVEAVFEQAARESADPWEVSVLATQAVIRMLNRGLARIDSALSYGPRSTRRPRYPRAKAHRTRCRSQ